MTFRVLISCATLRLMCTAAAADDVLAMLQNSLRVNQNQQGLEQNAAVQDPENPESPEMAGISRLEELVMARVRDGLLGDNNMTATINASIKTYQTGIIATTASNQAKIIADIKAFAKCKTTMWKKYDGVIPVEKDFWILGNIYPKCWRAETNLATAKKVADTKEKTLKNDVKVSKKLLKAEERKCTNVCNNNKEENYNEQLDRLADYYTKCKKAIKPKLDAMEKVTKQYKTAVKQKKLGDARYEAMKKKCKLIAYRMNNKKCDARKKFAGSCSFYEECWKRSKMVYDKDVKRIKVQEKEMKIEWRALHRIQCYLLVLNIKNDKDQKKEKAQLNKCIGIKKDQISTKHLDIDYKKIPKKPKCPQDPWCPCTKAYVNYYYKVGPKKRCVNNIVKKYKCPACKR